MSGGSQPKPQQQPQSTPTPTPAPVKKTVNRGVEKAPNILTGPSASLGTADTAKNKLGL